MFKPVKIYSNKDVQDKAQPITDNNNQLSTIEGIGTIERNPTQREVTEIDINKPPLNILESKQSPSIPNEVEMIEFSYEFKGSDENYNMPSSVINI